MTLSNVLQHLNSFEKNAFLKILDNIINSNSVDRKKIDALLSSSDNDLKNADNNNIAKVFTFLEAEYTAHLEEHMKSIMSQLDIVVDIITRDGNTIMKYDWFSLLYTKELKGLKKSIKELERSLQDEKSEIDPQRKRDYRIYRKCLSTAYENDLMHNQDAKISYDEQALLQVLSEELELSQQEIKNINYMTIPLEKKDIDSLISELKNIGMLFFSKKFNTLYIPNEFVSILRQIKKRPVADKYLKRVLKQLKEPQINLVCKKHNIPFKGIETDVKINAIIQSNINFYELLANSIHKPTTTLNEKKLFLNEFAENALQLPEPLKGSTVDEKVTNLINYYIELDKDNKIGIPLGGYEQLLIDLKATFNNRFNDYVKKEFELQEDKVLNASYLLDYNIKPRDVVELLSDEQLKKYCQQHTIKARGNLVANILEAYKDMKFLEFENYVNVGYRDLNALKNNGLQCKESELGIKFEDITKNMFLALGFNVDEALRKKLNTNKDKIDILINLGNDEIIIVECKTVKESGYNKFSSASRQIKSYVSLAEKSNMKVIKSLLIAPEFSDDFVKECELDYELNLSLVKAESLKAIVDAFENSKLKELPYNLLMRDVIIKEDRIVMALKK